MPIISNRQDIVQNTPQYQLEVEYQDDISSESESNYTVSDNEFEEQEETAAVPDLGDTSDVTSETVQASKEDVLGGNTQVPEPTSLSSNLRLRKPVYSSDEEDHDHWEGDHHRELSHLSQTSLHGEDSMFKRQDRGPVIPFHVDGDDKYGKLPLGGRTQVRKRGTKDA